MGDYGSRVFADVVDSAKSRLHERRISRLPAGIGAGNKE